MQADMFKIFCFLEVNYITITLQCDYKSPRYLSICVWLGLGSKNKLY